MARVELQCAQQRRLGIVKSLPVRKYQGEVELSAVIAGRKPGRFAEARLGGIQRPDLVLGDPASDPDRGGNVAASGEQLAECGIGSSEVIAFEQHIGEIAQCFGLPGFGGEHLTVARFGALAFTGGLERQPEIAKQAGVPRGRGQREFVFDDRRVGLAALAEQIAEVKPGLGVSGIDREHAPPRCLGLGGRSCTERFTQKVPCGRLIRDTRQHGAAAGLRRGVVA